MTPIALNKGEFGFMVIIRRGCDRILSGKVFAGDRIRLVWRFPKQVSAISAVVCCIGSRNGAKSNRTKMERRYLDTTYKRRNYGIRPQFSIAT
jgi:hypothetical protein